MGDGGGAMAQVRNRLRRKQSAEEAICGGKGPPFQPRPSLNGRGGRGGARRQRAREREHGLTRNVREPFSLPRTRVPNLLSGGNAGV